MADETTTSQPAPEVARVWHTVIEQGWVLRATNVRATADTVREIAGAADPSWVRSVAVVEQPPREAVEALATRIAHAAADYQQSCANGDVEFTALIRADMATRDLLRLLGHDA